MSYIESILTVGFIVLLIKVYVDDWFDGGDGYAF